MTTPVKADATPRACAEGTQVTRSAATGRFVRPKGGVTRRSSDLSKKSAEVFAQAEVEPVTVTRRDGEPMVLMAADRAEEMDHLLASAASFTQTLLRGQDDLVATMSEVYPWMLAMSPDDRALCASELREAALASFSTGRARPLEEAEASWRGTAEAVAAGLAHADLNWLDEQPLVDQP